MANYYEIKKLYGILLEKVNEPKKNAFGVWSIYINYWFICPYCNKKDNSLQNDTWGGSGEHHTPGRSGSSKRCSDCKKDYKPILIAKCDFSKL